MNILGIYGCCGWSPDEAWLHSAGACLFVDNKLKTAISEERLSRVKYDGSYPRLAIGYVLSANNLSKNDITDVVYVHNLHSTRRSISITAILMREFPNAHIDFCDHHQAHAYSAFYTSNFDSAHVLSLDGAGNLFLGHVNQWETGLFAVVTKFHGMNVLLHAKNGMGSPLVFNVGQVFNDISRYIYDRMCPDATFPNSFLKMETCPGKVMGLAGYGNAKNVIHDPLWTIENNNKCSFYFPTIVDNQVSTSKLDRFAPEDIAAWLEQQLTNAYIGFFDALLQRYDNGSGCLCLTGGVALNVIANRALLDSNKYNHIYIPPFPNDTGLCIGGAIAGVLRYSSHISVPTNVALLGREYSDEEIEREFNGA